MKKNFKVLSLIAIGSSMVIGAVALSLSGTFSNLNSRFARAVGNEYSVEFKREDAYSASGTTYAYKKQTPGGNDVYLVSTGGNSRTSGYLATIPSMFDSTVAAVNMKFYHDSDATSPFRHQTISSLTIKTSGSIQLKIQTSQDGVTYRDKGTLDCTSSGATLSSFSTTDRFVNITESSRASAARSISSVSITYECENQSESFVSGHYQTTITDDNGYNSTINLFLNSDYYGYLQFDNGKDSTSYYSLMTWEYDYIRGSVHLMYVKEAAGSIAGMEGTGTSTNYAGYRVFGRFSAGWDNYMALFDGYGSLFFHSSQASSTNPNQYQRSTATVLTVV